MPAGGYPGGPRLLAYLGRWSRELFTEIERVSQALDLLDGAAAAVEPVDAIECRIAEVLVRHVHEGPLLAREIQDGLTSCDPPLVDVPTAQEELLAVLDASPCFEEGPRWRYMLGHRYDCA